MMHNWMWGDWMYGYGMGWGWFGFILMIVFLVLVIAGIIYLVKVLAGGKSSTYFKEETAIDILKKRYAKGEIDAEEFARRKKDLES
ncbi:MAG: SHOCT domain-containing protein [Candidatus Aenigmatarchaeota archaeon]